MTTAVFDSQRRWVPKSQDPSIYSSKDQPKREIADEVSGKHFHEQIEAGLQQSKIDKIRYRSGVFYHQDRKKTTQDVRAQSSAQQPSTKEPVPVPVQHQNSSNKASKKQFVLTRVPQPM